jgi:GNAT superfamily N-acetyltransferase
MYRAAGTDARECFLFGGIGFHGNHRRFLGRWYRDWAACRLFGYLCTDDNTIVGYCFGDRDSGEIVVLAVLPQYEGRGIGKGLLSRVVEDLRSLRYARLFLGCSSDPSHRSYGFYRHLGWRATGSFDTNGDDVLELRWQDGTQEV